MADQMTGQPGETTQLLAVDVRSMDSLYAFYGRVTQQMMARGVDPNNLFPAIGTVLVAAMATYTTHAPMNLRMETLEAFLSQMRQSYREMLLAEGAADDPGRPN